VRPANVELSIEELVLHGFEPVDVRRISEAVEHELGRMFVEEGMPSLLAHTGEVARVDGGSFEDGPDLGAEAIGALVARAVYRGFGA
jgi:hypothetical protein